MTNLFETYRGTLYPWQADHMGHINVRFYAAKFDEATWQVFGRLGITSKYMKTHARGMAGLTQNTQFKKEMFPGDLITIQSGILEMKKKTIRFFHKIINCDTQEEIAYTEFLTVHMDTNLRKSVEFPDEILEKGISMLYTE